MQIPPHTTFSGANYEKRLQLGDNSMMTFFGGTRQFSSNCWYPPSTNHSEVVDSQCRTKMGILNIHIFHGKRVDFIFFNQWNLCSWFCFCSVILTPAQGQTAFSESWRHQQAHPMGKQSSSTQCLFSLIYLLKNALIYLRWRNLPWMRKTTEVIHA